MAVSGTLDVLPWLRIAGFASADWPDGFDGEFPLFYQRSAVTAAFPWDEGRLELSSRFEQDGLGLDDVYLLVSSGFRLSLDVAGRPAWAMLGAGHQYDGRLDEQLAYADASLSLFPLPSLALRTRGMARIAFDPMGSAPYFFSDPIGVADVSLVNAVGRAWYGATLSVGWEPRGAAISLAELLVMRTISLALYGDAVWTAGSAQAASMVFGVRLGCDAALMGLKSSRFLFEAGMDAVSAAFIVRLFLLSTSLGKL
jgi:hypothetical protein